MNYKYVICGAGLTGIVLCNYLIKTKKISVDDIIIIEAGKEPGGLYKPWNSQKIGNVDKGMHIYYETGITEIDSIVYNSMSPNEWISLEGNRKDIAGAFFNNRLQHNTPYPDLSNFSNIDKEIFITEILQRLSQENNQQNQITSTCKDYWESKFGETITQNILSKIALKLYGHSASELHSTAAYTTKLDRVCLFSAQTMEELGVCSKLRASLAYPDQLRMPNYRTTNQRGLYPIKGMKYLTEKMAESLENLGVKILYQTSVISATKNSCKVASNNNDSEAIALTVNNNISKSTFTLSANQLIWTGAQKFLEKTLKQEHDRPHYHEQINQQSQQESSFSMFLYYQIKKANHNLKELYYAYFYDEITRPFRITNLTSYSQPASSNENSLDTLCVEYHLTKEQASKLKINANTSINSLAETEFNELRMLDIVSNEYKAADGFIIPKRIFPIPLTTQSKQDNILEDEMRSIVYNGKEVGRSNFFLVDTLKSFHHQLHEK